MIRFSLLDFALRDVSVRSPRNPVKRTMCLREVVNSLCCCLSPGRGAKPPTTLPFHRLDLGMEVVPRAECLNGPSITHEETKASRSSVVYSINQWAARLHVSELRLLSAKANPSQLPSTPLKVNAPLPGQELHTECTGLSGGRATLETHFCFVYWGERGTGGGMRQEVFSEDANIEFKLDAKSNLQGLGVEMLW